MLDIEVLTPTRTDSLYEFRCSLDPHPSLGDRSRRRGPQGASLRSSGLQFGFRARNFTIAHHEVWDSFYPLFFLTRNGGPLFDRIFDRARIRFHYPISAIVRDFFTRRAADFGITITVEADTTEARLDQPTSGNVLAFGGGKDSRLLLGLLREFGSDPVVITAKGANALDIRDALVTESLHGALVDRIMPSYMALGRRLYFGGTIGDVHLETPWQQHYDFSSPGPIAQMSGLLAALGVEMEILTPATVLPYNIIQRILHDRYPDLYRYQVSTRPGSHSEKSLHIALIKMVNGYSFEGQCSDEVFGQMLEKFVRRQTAEPADHGYRNRRLTVQREMRAIIWRLRDGPIFAAVRDLIPDDWDASWIDYIHPYVLPTLEPEYLAIYRHYAVSVGDVDPATTIWRIPI